MGGLLRGCGCYDGPFGPGDDHPVSIRCVDHRGAPAWAGYELLYKDKRGRLAKPAEPSPVKLGRLPKMAVPRGRRR